MLQLIRDMVLNRTV